jgi:predicted membrane protein
MNIIYSNVENPDDDPENEKPRPLPRRIIFGLFLVCLGLLFILDNLEVFDIWALVYLAPATLVVIGILLIRKKGFFSFWVQLFLFCGFMVNTAMALEDYKIIIKWWPISIIWIGFLFFLKGYLVRKKQIEEEIARKEQEELEKELERERELERREGKTSEL